MHSAHRRGLRDRPELAGMTAEAAVVNVDGEIRERAPEVVERHTTPGSVALIVDIDRPIDDYIAGRLAEAGDHGVIANLKIQRIGRGPVCSGREE